MSNDQANNPFDEYATGETIPLTEQEQAEQQYLSESGLADAIFSGLSEGLLFGWSDEIQSLYDKGPIAPKRKTELLKAKYPAAYLTSDILGSLATAAIPIPGTSARLATRIGAEALKGGLESAGRAEEGERLGAAAAGAGVGAGIGAVGGGAAKLYEKSKKARADKGLIKAGEVVMRTEEGKKLTAIEKKISDIDQKLLSLPAEKEIQKAKQAREIDKDILKAQADIAELEAKGVIPGLAEKKKELEALQQTLSKQTGAVAETEQALTSVAQRFELDPEKLAKMQEAILKGRQEVARLEAQGVTEVPQELLNSLAQTEKQFADATKRVQASEKGIFDIEEQLARLAEKELAAAQPAKQAGLFAPQTVGDLPGIAAARGEELAVAGLRRRELEKRLTEQQFAQKAMDDLRMAVEQARKQPPKMPSDLPFARERLAAAEAAPAAAKDALQRAMQSEVAKLEGQLASGQASKQETQQAIEMLMKQVDELIAGPKQMPPSLPFKQQELAALMARKASPEPVAAEAIQKSLQSQVPQLEAQRALAQQLFNKKLEELSEVELNKLEKVMRVALPGTKLTRPVTAIEVAETAARTGAARSGIGR